MSASATEAEARADAAWKPKTNPWLVDSLACLTKTPAS